MPLAPSGDEAPSRRLLQWASEWKPPDAEEPAGPPAPLSSDSSGSLEEDQQPDECTATIVNNAIASHVHDMPPGLQAAVQVWSWHPQEHAA